MNSAWPRRVSLISALGLPTILSPTIGATSGDRPAARRFGSRLSPALQASSLHSRLAHPRQPNRVHGGSPRRTICVTDWSFSFRCSPPRIAATQLRFDTARLFTAQKRTSTAPSSCLLRRTAPLLRRLHPPALRSIFVQTKMTSAGVIVSKITFQDAMQMSTVEHQHMVQALAPNGADESLHIGGLSGAGGCNSQFL